MDYNEFKSRLYVLEKVMIAIPNWPILESAGITRDEYHDDQDFISSCKYSSSKMIKDNMKNLNVLYTKYTKVKYGS